MSPTRPSARVASMTAPATLLALVEEARNPDFRQELQHLRSWSQIDWLLMSFADALEALIPPQAQDERKVTREEIAQIVEDACCAYEDATKKSDLSEIVEEASNRLLALLNPEGRGS